MTPKTRVTSAALVLCGVLSMAHADAAADHKIYYALECRGREDGDGIRVKGYGLENTANTQTKTVYCPVMRDLLVDGPDLSIRVRQRSDDPTSCRAVAISRELGYKRYGGWVRNSTRGRVKLSLPVPVLYTDGWLVIECQLPPETSDGTTSIGQYAIYE